MIRLKQTVLTSVLLVVTAHQAVASDGVTHKTEMRSLIETGFEGKNKNTGTTPSQERKIFISDVVQAFESVGFPMENIVIKGRDEHDYVMSLKCLDKKSSTDTLKSGVKAEKDAMMNTSKTQPDQMCN